MINFLTNLYNVGETAIIFFVVLSILVLIHEFGHFFVAKRNGILVEEFGLGIPPRLWGKKIGETIYSINWLPFGGFVKLLGEDQNDLDNSKLSSSLQNRSFAAKSVWARLAVVTAGVVMNFLLGWFFIAIIISQTGVPKPLGFVKVESVLPGSPASQAGLLAGDEIRSLKQGDLKVELTEVDTLIAKAKELADTSVVLDVKRDKDMLQMTLTPRSNPPPGQGAMGISITSTVLSKVSLMELPVVSFKQSAYISLRIFQELGKMIQSLFRGQSVAGEVAGPVKIASMTSEAAKSGFLDLLNFMALLSLNLAVVNILPFPALDGGRVVFLLYEAVTRRKAPPKFEAWVNLIGFLFLISMIILVTALDVRALFK